MRRFTRGPHTFELWRMELLYESFSYTEPLSLAICSTSHKLRILAIFFVEELIAQKKSSRKVVKIQIDRSPDIMNDREGGRINGFFT